MSRSQHPSSSHLPHVSGAEGWEPRFVPLAWQREGMAEQAALAKSVLIDALVTSGSFSSFSFVISSNNGEIEAGYLVDGVSPESGEILARTIEAIDLTSGTGPVEAWSRKTSTERWQLGVDNEAPGRRVLNHISPAWAVARSSPNQVWLRVDVVSGMNNDGTLTCRIGVGGDASLAEQVAGLTCVDTPGPFRLVSKVPHEVDELIDLPIEMVAHLLAVPARIPGAWPSSEPVAPERVLAAFDDVVPPHAAVFGGSGLGKTTLLEHLVATGVEAGRAVVVIDPHGDLSARAVGVAAELDVDAADIDFGSPLAPQWNLCAPPAGFDPDEWVTELVRSVRSAWPDMPEEFFGPVGQKSLRVALAVLVRDPAGPLPLTQAVSVLTEPGRWRNRLADIGDPALSADYASVVDAIRGDRTQHMSVWATSKLEPFVSDPRLTRIIDTTQPLDALDQVREGRSLFCSASSAQLGEAGANVLSSALLSQLWMGVQRFGAETPIDIVVDEVHRIPAPLLIALLQEGRKFGVRLRMATQSPLQLTSQLRQAALANSGAVATFRCGFEESRMLAHHFASTEPLTLRHLERHHVAIATGNGDLVGPSPAPR